MVRSFFLSLTILPPHNTHTWPNSQMNKCFRYGRVCWWIPHRCMHSLLCNIIINTVCCLFVHTHFNILSLVEIFFLPSVDRCLSDQLIQSTGDINTDQSIRIVNWCLILSSSCYWHVILTETKFYSNNIHYFLQSWFSSYAVFVC